MSVHTYQLVPVPHTGDSSGEPDPTPPNYPAIHPVFVHLQGRPTFFGRSASMPRQIAAPRTRRPVGPLNSPIAGADTAAALPGPASAKPRTGAFLPPVAEGEPRCLGCCRAAGEPCESTAVVGGS